MQQDMNQSHLETKVKLLTEVLNKRNEDIQEMEEESKKMLELVEDYEGKLIKMKEEVEVQALKVEKYEEHLSGKVKPIEVDTIDGRINFLVSVLESYKQ